MRHGLYVGTLTIPNGTDVSEWKDVKLFGGGATDMIIYAPAAATGTFTVEVSHKQVPSAGDERTLKVDGNAVALGAGDACIVPSSAYRAIRIKSSGNEAAERIFNIVAQMDV